MISLTPPYHVVDGYTLLPDHADERQFYVLPPAPALAREADGRPAFSLLQYLGGGAGAAKLAGGLLTLTTVLATPDAVLTQLATKLQDKLGGHQGPLRLSPVLFDNGTVELIALGNTSAPPAANGAPPAGGDIPAPTAPFQVRFLGAGRPALGGDNRAVFQLLLDETAAVLVARSLEVPDLPLIAIYRLSFAALRPSYSIRIEADWSRVYHSLQQKAMANAWILAADANHLITSTLQENNITVETAIFGTGPEAQAAAARAQRQLIEWILQRMFAPQADPAAATANSIGQVVDDTVWSIARSVLPGVGYRLRAIDESELRLLSARMDEAVAEAHEVIPQGTLGGMLNSYRVDAQGAVRPDWDQRRARLLSEVNLNGFPRLEVQVGAEDRFSSDGLRQVEVEMERLDAAGAGHDAHTFVFRDATERKPYIVNLLGADAVDLAQPYHYRTTVKFDPSAPFGQTTDLQTDWKTGRVSELYVEPREAYWVQEMTIAVAPTFTFDQYPVVVVELRYQTPDRAPQSGRVELKPGHEQGTWRYAVFGALPKACEYRLNYLRPPGQGAAIVNEWQPHCDKWLSVADPMPVKRPLTLFVSLPWDEVSVAFVQIRYADDAHGIHYDETLDLNSSTPFIRRDYGIAAQGPRTLSYRLTVFLTSGQLMEGSWRETEDERLVIDRRLVDSRRLVVRTLGGSMAQNRLRTVKLRLQVLDPGSGQLRDGTELAVLPGQETEPLHWEYLLGDPPAKNVRYTAIFVDNDGFVTQSPEAQTQADLIILRLNTKSVNA